MSRSLTLLLLLCSACCFSQVTTFSDYFATADDYALSQLSYSLEGRTDTLLGQCVDSLLAGKPAAARQLSERVLVQEEAQPLAYFLRGLAEADLQRPRAAFADLDTAIALAPQLVSAYVAKGSLHVSREEYDLAAEVYRTAAARNPQAPEPHFLRGVLTLLDNHPVRARKLWEESVAIDSCYIPARIAILGQRLSAGRMNLGIREIRELRACNDLSDAVHHLLALAAAEKDDYEQALYHINTAISLNPENAKHLRYRSQLRTTREEYYPALLDLYQAYTVITSVEEERDRGKFELSNRRQEMTYALNYFRFQGSFDPELYETYSAYLLYLARYDFDNAKRWERKLRAAGQDDHPGFLYFRALAVHRDWNSGGDPTPLIDQALAADPSIVDLYRLRGQAKLREGDYRAAFNAFQKMGELEPKNIASLRGIALALAGSDRPAAAMNVMEQVLLIDSTDEAALLLLADYYYAEAQYAKSDTYYDRLLEYRPRHRLALHRSAVCHYLLGKTNEALEDLQLIDEEYYRINSEVVNLRGLVYLGLDSLDQAMHDFNTAIAADQELLEAYLNRARVNLKRGKYDTALRELDYYIERAPDNLFGYVTRARVKAQLNDATACDDLTHAIRLGYQPLAGEQDSCCPQPSTKR